MKKILFSFLVIIHYLVWIFVLFAFINSKTAYINLYMLVPFIYIIHLFPFHFIVKAKEIIIPDNEKRNEELINYDRFFILPYYFMKFQEKINNFCIFSPISPQGMLIFGALSCAFVLRNKK